MNRTDEAVTTDETPMNQPPGWYVLPKPGGGWRVHDGGTPAPAAVFDRKTDAIAFARRQAACPCASNGGSARKPVVIFNRPRKLSPDEMNARYEGYDFRLPRPTPPGGRSFRGPRRKYWMSDDFDELPAEIAEFFE
ncbi:DUF2188 domain-containing protein [Longimicrobium terrae]|uniref:DUF2188 domain-containing protein n=1 Tax=Longimicrobium terrae TaxID=1639882 RepID=A0A841GXC8_9BACT|nr:DUF2188 domain-containing protein [Longimicrobium terrae]MBB4635572.1 hypothetical protein [Longimicrobium terrae]MBB6069966.1 hypothetical protein [Longimicrobium terrae]NNC32877.1 DUF2188 domain-containing protein [Longimicrobium terrae]